MSDEIIAPASDEAIEAGANELWGSAPSEQVDEPTGEESSSEEQPAESESAESASESSEPSDDSTNELSDEPGEQPDEATELRNRIEALQKLIESQALEALAQPVRQNAKTAETDSNQAPQDAASLAEFIGELDFDEIRDDPKAFLEVLNKVAAFSSQQTLLNLKTHLPSLVNERTTQVVTMQKLVDDFYRENNELAGVKQTVGIVARNVGAENPSWDMPMILVEAAKRTRSMLGLKEAVKTTAGSKAKRSGEKPSLPGKANSNRGVKPKELSPLAKEVAELFNLN